MNTSPKIYTLKNKEGKFVTHNPIRGYEFCFKIHDAKFSKKQTEAEAIKPTIEKLLGEELFLETTTEQDYWHSFGLTTTQAIIAGDYFMEFLNLINYNIPTISQVNKNVKNSLTNTLNNLKQINTKFKEFETKKNEQTFDVLAFYQEMIHELSKIEFYECCNITNILKAYRKDPKSINGIVKKINQ